jgi:hypothetical protein
MVAPRIRWAPRLRPRLLERLYESDAKGIRDGELCDDVGLRLHARCRAFVLVDRSEVDCPSCEQVFAVATRGSTRCPGEDCDWLTTRREYAESLRKHYAHTGRAIEAFAKFHQRYPTAGSYTDKILLIDELIHSFHLEEASGAPVKSVASKLLEGNKTEVVRFLDRLSALDPTAKERWRHLASRTIHQRLVKPAADEGTRRT